MIDVARYELKHTFRQLRRSPAFAFAVIASFAVGIAALISVAWLADNLLLRGPALIQDSPRVVAIGDWKNHNYLSYPDYRDFAQQARSFTGIAAFSPAAYSVRLDDGVAQARTLLVSSNFLTVLGVRPMRGHDFEATEDVPGATHTVLVSSDFWHAHFAGSNDVLNEFLEIGGEKYAVLGVLPKGFTGADLNRVDLLLPIASTPSFGASDGLDSRATQWVRALGRLRESALPAAASAEATGIYKRANASNPATDAATLAKVVIPVTRVTEVRRDWAAPTTRITLWLLGLAIVLLALTCVNVATLFVARVRERRKSMAIHLALGATRGRLMARVIYELGAVVLTGAVLAVALSIPVIRGLASLFVSDVLAVPSGLDARSVVISAIGCAFSLAVCVAITAATVAHVEPADGLRETSSRSSYGSRRAMRILLGVQIAAASLLVTGAQMFALSLRGARHVQFGMTLDHLVVADVDFEAAGYSSAEVATLVPRILERLGQEPDVVAVAVTNASAFPSFLTYTHTVPDGNPRAALKGEIGVSAVTPEFFAAVGIERSSGALFTEGDASAARPVMVVSEAFAAHFWPGRSPLGECVKVGGPRAVCNEVVGVVKDRRGGYDDPSATLETFVPFGSPTLPRGIARNFIGRQVAIRVRGSPVAASARIGRILNELVSRALLIRTAPAWDALEPQQRNWQIGTSVLGGFGAIALLLSAIGVFAVARHSLAARRREFAIRRAIGAASSQLIMAALSDITLAGGVGVFAGLIGSEIVARAMTRLLYGVSPTDVSIYGATLAILAAVALLAALDPLSTVLRVEPTEVLNAE